MNYLKSIFSPIFSSNPSASAGPSPNTSASPSPTPSSDAEPAPETEERKITWSNSERNKMLQELSDYRTSLKVERLNIMLTGLTGAGKSTFINSVQTAFLGRMCSIALTNASLVEGVVNDSFTLKYKTHKLKNKDGSFLPFVISDTMGIDPDESSGILNEDIINILQGKIKEGYSFNPYHSITEKDACYNRKPSLNEKVHCLVFVLPANNLSLISTDTVKKMRDVRKIARNLEIPQVVIMTKVDEVCPLVKKDLKQIYISKKINKTMNECECRLGLPINYIFPVKNYRKQIDANLEIDILILQALTNIVNIANDFVEGQTEEQNSS